ncbi:MAG: LrgB family protein [Coriobacteriales bacterium]|jgi:predicted murein hydrolase (TIGR00659 family)
MSFLHLMFGIVISLVAFQGAVLLNRKIRTPLLNPLLVAVTFIIIVLSVFHIPLQDYQAGGKVISYFLGPATAVLAYSIYRQFAILKRHFIPIFVGCLAGSITSMVSAYLLCRAFGMDQAVAMSTLPKSVTTPIAMSVSQELGGITSITVAVVIASGIMGSILAPTLIRLFRVKSPIAAGVAIGTCSHAVGTTKAMEIGELEGAMSGIAIGVSGLLTMIIAMLYHTALGA